MNKQVIIDLYISSDEYLKLYQGVAQNVSAKARDGRWVRFPAEILRDFVTHTGIEGSFVITFDANNKFMRIDRL